MSVDVRCYETMGVPNSEAECNVCGLRTTYFPRRAREEGFDSDFAAAQAWAKAHVCTRSGWEAPSGGLSSPPGPADLGREVRESSPQQANQP